MNRQHCSKNVVSTSNIENSISYSLLTTYGSKSIELNIMKDLMNMYQNSILEKEEILRQEKQKLEELNDHLWSLKDVVCIQVWQFSCEHNFSSMFKYYPLIMATNHWTEQRNYYKNDMEMSTNLVDLINEIDVIKMEICSLNRGKIFKEDVESALTNLKKLQLISDDVTELLKLISSSESSYVLTTISMPICDEIIPNHDNKIKRRKNSSNHNNLNLNKKIRGTQKETSIKINSYLKNEKNEKVNSTNQKKIIMTKNYPQLLLEKSVIFSAERNITDVSIDSTSRKELKNFNLKKRSEISVRFEQYRQHK